MRRLRWRWHCWRVRHYVWLAYVEWWRHPSAVSERIYQDWERHWEHLVDFGP